MRKKLFDKVLSVASTLIALIFVVILLVTIFGGIDVKDFENTLVKGLFVAFAVIYLATSIGAMIYVFVDSDALKDVILNSENGSNTRSSAAVIKKIVKKSMSDVEGVKCQKIGLVSTEYGVRLKVAIKITGRDIQQTSIYLKCLLEDTFLKMLGYKFYSIDFKISSLKSDYVPKKEAIEAKAKKIYETIKPEDDSTQIETAAGEQETDVEQSGAEE